MSPCGMFNVFVFFVRGFAFLFAPVLTDLCFALVWYFVLAFVLLLCIFLAFCTWFLDYIYFSLFRLFIKASLCLVFGSSQTFVA